MSKRKNQIFIATPCYGGMLTDAYTIGLMSLVQHFERNKVSYTVNLMGNQSLITRARNKLTAMFMEDTRNTHLMFIDSDIAFNADDVVKLIEHDKDVVSGAYPKKGVHLDVVKKAIDEGDEEFWTAGTFFNITPNFSSKKTKSVKVKGDLMDTLYTGSGFLLIKRKVIAKIIKAYPKKKCWDDEEFEKNYGKYYYDIFSAGVDPKTKLYLSEDYYFCQLVKKLGFDIWVDTSITLGHIGTYAYWGNLEKYLGLE